MLSCHRLCRFHLLERSDEIMSRAWKYARWKKCLALLTIVVIEDLQNYWRTWEHQTIEQHVTAVLMLTNRDFELLRKRFVTNRVSGERFVTPETNFQTAQSVNTSETYLQTR